MRIDDFAPTKNTQTKNNSKSATNGPPVGVAAWMGGEFGRPLSKTKLHEREITHTFQNEARFYVFLDKKLGIQVISN
jgi:hypothetical protein